MVKLWGRRVLVATFCALAVFPSVSRAGAPGDATGALAKLEALAASPSLRKPPAGVEGDFAVVKEAPKIEFAVLPGQWPGAELWSAWGDALWASDGKCYASIGDHASPHGYSYVYRVDPETKEVKLIVDVNAVLKIPPEKYTAGKIHAPLVDLGDGWMYFVTYRGSVRGTTKENGYEGDWLFRYELKTGKLENLGIMVPHSSVPVLVGHPRTKRLYGLSAPGKTMPTFRKQLFVYDVEQRKLVFAGGPESTMCRALILADDGRAYYDSEGMLVRYDPKVNKVVNTQARLPGDANLRAASRPDANGVVYCFTSGGTGFSFDTKTEAVKETTKAFVAGPLYTTACKLEPSGRYLYYAPGAHGRTKQHGTAVLQLDVKTGKRKVVAFLNECVRAQKNYNLGGTYALALNDDGSKLFICWNGNVATERKNDFGLCSVMVIRLPESERRTKP